MDEILKVLIDLRNKRRDKHIAPDYIPGNEVSVSGYDREQLRVGLNKLYQEGCIKVHRGINQNLIEVLKEDYSPNK